jgi:hypothetical protein
MAGPRIYVETSVISYLTALGSRDLVLSAHQEVTRNWWAARDRFELFISQFVVDEASSGDPVAAARRLDALNGLALLDISDAAAGLAVELVDKGGLPSKAKVDALHVAIAADNGMDYLLTWNCTHIANAALRGRIEAICRACGVEPPTICTPLELMQD